MKLRRNLNNSEEGFKAQQTCPQSHISSNQKQGWGGDIRLFLVGGMVVLWSSRDAAFMSHITQAEVRRKAFQRCSSLSLNSLIHQAGLEWMFFYGLSSVPWCESGVNRCLFMSPQEVLQYYCLTVDGRLWDPERVCRIQQSFRGVYLQLSHIGGGIISHREWLWLTLSLSPLSPSGQWTQCVRDVAVKHRQLDDEALTPSVQHSLSSDSRLFGFYFILERFPPSSVHLVFSGFANLFR